MSETKDVVVQQQSPVMLKSWDELMQRADFFAKSALIPQALRGKPADVAIILQMGWELGIPPLQALNGIDVINGKPTVSPELTVALIRSKIPNAFIKVEEDHAKMEVRVTMARDRDRKDEAYTSVWNKDRAAKLGLLGKDNYQKQPMTMLAWRATKEAARRVFPDVGKGLDYSKDEIEDFAGQDETPQDKASRIVSIVKAEKIDKIEKADVQEAEIVTDVAPETESLHPLADYVMPIGQLKGKKLKDLSVETLKNVVAKTNAFFKNDPKGSWLEMVVKIEAYVAYQSLAQPEGEPSFDQYAEDPRLVK